MKTTLTTLLVIIVLAAIGAGVYFYSSHMKMVPAAPVDTMATTTPADTSTAMSTTTEVIGKSVQGRDITAYHYGNGTDEVLLIGGIHGGYEANTSLVAFQTMDYLAAHPEAIPANERITVIPELNPDGLNKVVTVGADGRFAASDVPTTLADTVPGRFNANTVDLNRNFDCHWAATGVWQNTKVSGGTAAFSEPESQAVRDYVANHKPVAALAWYSSAGGVYSAGCDGVTTATTDLTNLFAKASGYTAHASFDAYATTGDMTNWLASQSIPTISVLLTNHTDTDWDKNQKGIMAMLSAYAK